MTVVPATVRVPVRPTPLVFLATVNVDVPGPTPDMPAVMVIQATLLLTVQPHADVVLTASDFEPPVLVNEKAVPDNV